MANQTQYHVHTAIVGGGQAGLAMSRCLLDHSIENVILERGLVGERWRSSYWDSLRLLTPNWYSRLPGGWKYSGSDEDGFMTATEFVGYLQNYSESFDAPVRTNTAVVDIKEITDPEKSTMARFELTTEQGTTWLAQKVVIATGFCDISKVPCCASNLPPFVKQIVASDYRNPSQVFDSEFVRKPRKLLVVVGSGASGLQIAQELAVTARQYPGTKVMISTGKHTRCPRSYRGKDIVWWLDQMGDLASEVNQELEASVPGPQLAGGQEHSDISLYTLKHKYNVEVVGRLQNGSTDCIHFDNTSLSEDVSNAESKCIKLMEVIDAFVDKNGITTSNTPNLTAPPKAHEELCPRLDLDSQPIDIMIDLLNGEQSTCIIWATGFRREYPFLSEELIQKLWDPERHALRNDRGVTGVPGLYVLGYRWLVRKNSNFIDGVGHDAADLVQHMLLQDAMEEYSALKRV